MKFSQQQTLKQIADLLQIDFVGSEDFPVLGLNEIHVVEAGDIVFVDHPKYYDKALNSAATIVLINKKVDCPQGKALLISEDPFSDFNRLSQHFNPFTPANKSISESAIIGKGTIIQPNVFIGNNVQIGNDCVIHPNVTIYDGTIIGNNVIIHAGTVLGADAFYYQKRAKGWDKFVSCGRVVIQDNVEIGASCTIDRGVTGDTIIGEGSKLDNQIQVGHDTSIGKECLIASHVGIAGCVVIEDEVTIWGQVGVASVVTIGKKAVILGQSGVTKNLEGGKTYFGLPAEEAREKYKEMASIKKIPEIIQKIKDKK